jgi:hypothetical protein
MAQNWYAKMKWNGKQRVGTNEGQPKVEEIVPAAKLVEQN